MLGEMKREKEEREGEREERRERKEEERKGGRMEVFFFSLFCHSIVFLLFHFYLSLEMTKEP